MELLEKNLAAIFASIAAGVLTSLGSVLRWPWVLKLERAHAVSFLPKSVTTAIGMDVAETLGGTAALAGAVIILTGIVGSLLGETVCKVCRITDPLAKGLALGTSAHAIGTSKALQMGEIEGAMSGLCDCRSGHHDRDFGTGCGEFFCRKRTAAVRLGRSGPEAAAPLFGVNTRVYQSAGAAPSIPATPTLLKGGSGRVQGRACPALSSAQKVPPLTWCTSWLSSPMRPQRLIDAAHIVGRMTPARSRRRRLSSVRICSVKMMLSLASPQRSARTLMCVGRRFLSWRLVMAAAMTVGLCRLPISF